MIDTQVPFAEAATSLDRWQLAIGQVLAASEAGIGETARCFEALASRSGAVNQLACGIVSSVEDEAVRTVLPRARNVVAVARDFIGQRLKASGRILETATAEARLLGRLSQLTRAQRSVARETQTLAMLTNIEVARLGQLGKGFGYLARELQQFSEAVAEGTRELNTHTEERIHSIEQTRSRLAQDLPRMKTDLVRIGTGLEQALEGVDSSLDKLQGAPACFRASVEEIAHQVASVVAAVQGHDITRQQIEHVSEALGLIAALDFSGAEQNQAAAGLAVQQLQLGNICQTAGVWVDQIRSSVAAILDVNCSEVVSIAPLVLAQEKSLSEQLAHVDQLEQECEADNEQVRATLEGLSGLMRLVGEHLERSRQVRDRLQLLTFNSIVEASRLGSDADAILEISQSIKRISATWSGITDQSAGAMDEILAMIDAASQDAELFSQEGRQNLIAAREETSQGLETLRRAAAAAQGYAAGLEEASAGLRTDAAEANKAGDQLDAAFAPLHALLTEMSVLQGEMEGAASGPLTAAQKAQAEEIFAASYTTEIERAILRSALYGEPLPSSGTVSAGNDVELF